MAYKNASSTYRETGITTASQGQLIIMLYDGADKQLNLAVELLELNITEKREPGRIEKIGKAIMKAEEIITELMVSLDFEQGEDIAKNLFALYTWFNRELMEANIAQDIKKVITVRDMICELRNSWKEIAGKYISDSVNREAVGLNIAG